ncbi:unnamed protein product [Menidia menidia]|uniref:(Atlantic silverside) hypothetical protein n=1 Tax=Menidia menidia TaxID=238744 RepID=A0A8S4AN56_9TELE|nr:unnamed protein product [Menidia menidia]
MTTSLWPQAPRALFISVKSAGPRMSELVSSGRRRGDARLNHQDPTQIGKGTALITVLDINDNAPAFAIDYETLLCENAMPGQHPPQEVLLHIFIFSGRSTKANC